MTTAFITGANRGIGLEIAKQLTARGTTVIAGCRKTSPELDALGVRVETVDVASKDSVAALAQRLDGTTIDLLVHNAGILQRTSLSDINEDSIVAQFQVNSLGPLRTTAALQGHIADGGKVVIVTSRMGSISDNTSGGSYGYRMKVDRTVIDRTRRWLLAKRKADGSFAPDASHLHDWSKIQANALPVTAYLTWALARSGASARDLAPSLRWLREHQAAADTGYVKALVALALTSAAPRHASAKRARRTLDAAGASGDEGTHWTAGMAE